MYLGIIILCISCITLFFVIISYLFNAPTRSQYFLVQKNKNKDIVYKTRIRNNAFYFTYGEDKIEIKYEANHWKYRTNENWKDIEDGIKINEETFLIEEEQVKTKINYVVFGILEIIFICGFLIFLLRNIENNDNNTTEYMNNNIDFDEEKRDEKDYTVSESDQNVYDTYSENSELSEEILYQAVKKCIENKDYMDAIEIINQISDYKDIDVLKDECQTQITIREKANTVSAGIRTSYGIDENGKVLVAGEITDENKKLISEWSEIVSIAGFGNKILGLRADGSVLSCGELTEDQKQIIAQWRDIIQISAGEQFCVGLTKEGYVVSCGHNGDKQTDVSSWSNITEIDTSWRLTAALDNQGKIWLTGYRAESLRKEIENNIDKWTNIKHISVGGGNDWDDVKGHIVGLRENGTVVAVGDNRCGQCNVEDWTDIVAVAAGDWHTVGLKKDGTVVVAGFERDNQIIYEDILEWDDIVAVSTGTGYTIGVKADGTVLHSGDNTAKTKQGILEWGKVMVYDEWDLR